MTVSQKVHIDTYDYGATLTVPTLNAVSDNSLVGTAASCGELAVDSGIYVAEFIGADPVDLIPAGTYRLRTTSGGLPLKWFVTFTGVDGELVFARTDYAVGLTPAVTTQLSTMASGITTLLARLGGWTGTGINTVLGGIRALAAKAASLTPTDISTGTTYNNAAHSLEARADTSAGIAAAVLERNPQDTGVITFAWPVSGATITGTVSINNATYVAIAGTIAFLREDAGRYYYTLSHNAADRPDVAGSARYTLSDGSYTRHIILRVVESGDTGEATATAILTKDWTTIDGAVPQRSALNALRHIRNRWTIVGDTKTVYAEDDATPVFTTAVTADGAGNITGDTPN